MGDKNDKTNTMHTVTLTTAAYFPSSSYSWYSSVNRVEVAVVAMAGAVSWGARALGYDGGWLSYGVREEGSLASNTGVPF